MRKFTLSSPNLKYNLYSLCSCRAPCFHTLVIFRSYRLLIDILIGRCQFNFKLLRM